MTDNQKSLHADRRKMLSVLFVILSISILFSLRTPAADMVALAKTNGRTLQKGKLVKDSTGIRYRFTSSGTYAKNIWVRIGTGIYCFNKNGYARKGWFEYNKKTYYANARGRVYHSKWLTRNGKKYYLQADGTLAKNRFLIIRSKKYRFTTKGVLVTYRLYEIRGKWYYSRKDGTVLTSGWLSTTSGKRYYFDQNGVRLQNQWVFSKGKFYYLKSNGVMAVNQTIGKYKVGADGARIIKSKKYVFLGDSRVVGMSQAVSNSSVTFIGKVSMGCSWMKSTAIPQLKTMLDETPTLYVVFCFGINDLGNIHEYISSYESLLSKYKYTNFFFMAVNPVDYAVSKAHGYSVTNTQIEEFNAKLKAAMGFRYVDTYSWLKRNGISTNDGIHYTSSTYLKLYNYMIGAMG